MKIKSIAAICKKNKNIAIFERYSDDGDILTQYIGDGSTVKRTCKRRFGISTDLFNERAQTAPQERSYSI